MSIKREGGGSGYSIDRNGKSRSSSCLTRRKKKKKIRFTSARRPKRGEGREEEEETRRVLFAYLVLALKREANPLILPHKMKKGTTSPSAAKGERMISRHAAPALWKKISTYEGGKKRKGKLTSSGGN